MDRLTPEQRHKNMQAVKSKGTKIEVKLGKAMWKLGLRYRKNYKKLPGKPDFVLVSAKIAVFCDGEFWHGKDWDERKNDIKSHQDFWFAKIEKNMKRDAEINSQLESLGWVVVRFWGKQIEKHVDECAETVLNIYKDRGN